MRREVFEGRDGFLTVGEAPGVTAQRNEYITDPANGELDMLFLFEHVDFDCEGTKWKPLPLDLPKLKSIMAGYQTAVQNAGWASYSPATTISRAWFPAGVTIPRKRLGSARPRPLA
mgnify:CR=1 FL=1